MRARLSRVALAASTVAASLVLVGQAGATFPGASGLLAFQSDRAADYGVWISNPDGSNPRVLYDPHGTHEFNPAWSPNGTQVVLQSGPLDRSTWDIVLVDVETGAATTLLGGPEDDRSPQFCDSDTIVFSRHSDAANADLYSIRRDGTALTRLTDAPGLDTFPTCSPDGERIAFNSNRGGPQAIWEIDRNGGDPRVLVPAVAVDPDYAPDGSALAYAAPDPADGNPELFLLDLATGAVSQRTQSPSTTQTRLPHFAPSFGTGVVPAGRSMLGPPVPSRVWMYYTHLDPGLRFPELNLGLEGVGTADPVILCGDPPAGPPGVPANPPPDDPGGPKNNSGVAAAPSVQCNLNSVGTLVIEGTEGNDTISLYLQGDGSLEVSANGQKITYRAGLVTGFTIKGRGGNDDIFTDQSLLEGQVDGGEGINRINGVVELSGTEGVDRVVVRSDPIAPELGGVETTHVMVVGRANASFPGRAIVKLGNAFNSKDVVSVDPLSTVVVNDWLTVGSLYPSSPVDPTPPVPGVVLIQGTKGDDEITVKKGKQGPLRISRNGEQAPGIAGRVNEVRVKGGGGNDTIDSNVPVTRTGSQRRVARSLGDLVPPVGGPLPVAIDAGAGNDRITCRGKGARCNVKAGAGNDTVDVRDGTRSVVDGGPGRDRVRADRGDRVRRAEIVIR